MAHEAKHKLSASQPGECDSYFHAVHLSRNVTNDILKQNKSETKYNSVTLVTQLDYTRLDELLLIIQLWQGAISAAIYTNKGTTPGIIKTLKKATHHRKNIGVHLVIKDGLYYPVNFLRNVALKTAFTKYVFTVDVDFLPSPNLEKSLERYLKSSPNADQVFVVPTFEQVDKGDVVFPRTKADVLEMWRQRILKPFHFRRIDGVDNETPAQGQINFKRWKKASTQYTVDWDEGFEPYLAFRKSKVPPFNEMFVGRYFNKVTQSMELAAKGFKFIVLPNVFLIHKWHEATPWSDVVYRCSTNTMLALKLQLMMKYKIKFAVTNNIQFASMFYLPRHPRKK